MSVDPTPSPAPEAPAAPPSAPETPTQAPAPQASWTDALDPDLKQEPTLGRYKTLNDLAKGFLETKKLASQKGFPIPAPDAPPEAWAEINKALGVPEEPGKYDLTGFEPPDGWDADFQTDALGVFHQARIPNGAAKQVLSWYAGRVAEAQKQQEALDAETTGRWDQQVVKQWGSATEQKLDLANRAFKTAFPEDVAAAIANARIEGGGRLKDHPAFLEAMAQMGEKLAEHQLLGDKQPTQFAKTPAEAQGEIQKLKYDAEFRDAFTNPRHSGHQQAKERWQRLHEQAFGNEPAANVIA